jgi:hypothetical protein
MSNEVAKQETQLPAEFLGKGFEGMEGQDFSFPFLVICQANSPYLNPTTPNYIESCRQSQIVNQSTMNIYNEINAIPVKYAFRYVEWKPRGIGGGFVASYERANAPDDLSIDPINGRTIRENGNELMGTAYYLCLLQEEGFDKVIIPMASTQLKKSKKWNSLMSSLKKDGKVQPPFNKMYTLSTVSESNNKGSWYGWKIEFADSEFIYDTNKELFMRANEISEQGSFLPEQLIRSIAQSNSTEHDDVV